MSTSARPFSFAESGRQSPFRRQNSASPATTRAATPTSSPTKATSGLSPTKPGALSPEKTSPFVRRPSQISRVPEPPLSPLARSTNSLGVPLSPRRQTSSSSNLDQNEERPESPRRLPSPPRRTTPPSMTAEPQTPTTPRDRGSPPPFDGSPMVASSGTTVIPSPAQLRPVAPRTVQPYTTSAVKPPTFSAAPNAGPKLNRNMGGFNHIPQPLLRSMRESFEVLDATNSGTITSASVASMLEQMGMDHDRSSLAEFFPPAAPSQLNLARYLDTLAAPLADLSHPEELLAAFEAFDVDDSGQIDVAELRQALLHTVPEPGEDWVRLSEREIDGVLGEFASRRAFGAKGLHAAKGKGEVFRYRDYMASVAGGPGDAGMAEAMTTAA